MTQTTPPEGLYAEHVRERVTRASAALSATGYDALVLSAGTPFTYFADDMDAPFHRLPHFAHWLPLQGPHHLLVVRPGARPRAIRVAPEDYWFEQAPLGDPFWLREIDVVEVPDVESAWKQAAPKGRVAYLGDDPAAARAHGIAADAVNPAGLVARLDWDRSYKTPYEVECLAEATRAAARGHRAAKEAFLEGGSELAIHQAYVTAVGCVDADLPYTSIVALDEKASILHYHAKRTERNGRVLLADVGAMHLGYGSDITRTWTAEGCDALFRDLVAGMDRLQRVLCDLVEPGFPYPQLHRAAHAKIADLLHATGILDAGGDEAVELGLTAPFFPHGLGHFLGIQVHDVAGRQASAEGGTVAPPKGHPYLRTTRTIEERMVFTIEPGLYFIEMLLRPLRTGPKSRHFDWTLVDRLVPFGGIRIEDDVVVTADGIRNLTRPEI